VVYFVAVLYAGTVLATYGYVFFGLFLKSLKNPDGSSRWTTEEVNVIPIGGGAINVVFGRSLLLLTLNPANDKCSMGMVFAFRPLTDSMGIDRRPGCYRIDSVHNNEHLDEPSEHSTSRSGICELFHQLPRPGYRASHLCLVE
jgi:hypothetical protein